MKLRRLLAVVLAAYLVVVASGAPLPLAAVVSWVTMIGEGDAPRFPCEACPCGCGTAEHCWGACCCHTLAQRLAWARREGVRPPETALDEGERAGLDIREWRPTAISTVRLTKIAPEKVEDAHDSLPPCCRKRLTCCEKPAGAPKPTTPTGRRSKPGVALLQAMACQGIAEAWLSLGQAPIAPSPELVTVDVAVYATELPAPLWCRLAEAPAPPPPDRG